MKEITRINHYGLRVTSLASARDFYEQLGFGFIAGPLEAVHDLFSPL